jgi:hypothetical protein
MSGAGRERRQATVRLAAGDVRVKAGFRLVTEDPLAGGPIELEFLAESIGSTPLQLAVGGDMARQRPGQFSFTGELDGLSLADPQTGVSDLGGPLGVVAVTRQAPWRQPLVLNDFLRLEDTAAKIAQGGSARLRLRCQRPIVLAATSAAALVGDGAKSIEVSLAFDLRRADKELADLAARLLDAVLHGPVSEREHPLALLLSMRGSALPQIKALTRHSDQAVAERARVGLARSTQAR